MAETWFISSADDATGLESCSCLLNCTEVFIGSLDMDDNFWSTLCDKRPFLLYRLVEATSRISKPCGSKVSMLDLDNTEAFLSPMYSEWSSLLSEPKR